MKEFLKWMQGGLVGLAALIYTSAVGGHFSMGVLAQSCGVAILVRAAGFVIQKFGPAPTA
jgi:hypothetical protein